MHIHYHNEWNKKNKGKRHRTQRMKTHTQTHIIIKVLSYVTLKSILAYIVCIRVTVCFYACVWSHPIISLISLPTKFITIIVVRSCPMHVLCVCVCVLCAFDLPVNIVLKQRVAGTAMWHEHAGLDSIQYKHWMRRQSRWLAHRQRYL